MEELLPVMIARKKTVDVLKFLADMTKNNATYIDTQLLCAVFRECYYPNKKQPIEEVSTLWQRSVLCVGYRKQNSSGKENSVPSNVNYDSQLSYC